MWWSRVVFAIDIWHLVRSWSGATLLNGLHEAIGLSRRVSLALVNVKVSWVIVMDYQIVYILSGTPGELG